MHTLVNWKLSILSKVHEEIGSDETNIKHQGHGLKAYQKYRIKGKEKLVIMNNERLLGLKVS